MNGACGTCGG